MQVLSKRDLLLLSLRYDIYDSPIPATFLRSAPSVIEDPGFPTRLPSPRNLSSYTLDESISIVLTSEIGRGASGIVHRGTLEANFAERSMQLDVAVKFAFTTEQKEDLRHEYNVYQRLKSNGITTGIATALGIFDDCEDGPCILIMLYSGSSLCGEPGVPCQYLIALLTLESIHHAGILHGDIRKENLLVSKSGITIIDFASSRKWVSQSERDQESRDLHCILGLDVE
ncbi:hypothetical protein BS47DRAFT_1400218 [Hydnum rufescens UP504]|uniref:Protein kinase domain-containing protein n=1 Tax=Hydnum rufescens UP504 TaxID=1448309 RepID=A0A9P6AH41_9AGAM|nr:hypothetical protein BS47DRAFT_1400218 [Hydnum rufescens UP504]